MPPIVDMTAKIERVERILKALLQFCQRNSSRLEDKARQVNEYIVHKFFYILQEIICTSTSDY